MAAVYSLADQPIDGHSLVNIGSLDSRRLGRTPVIVRWFTLLTALLLMTTYFSGVARADNIPIGSTTASGLQSSTIQSIAGTGGLLPRSLVASLVANNENATESQANVLAPGPISWETNLAQGSAVSEILDGFASVSAQPAFLSALQDYSSTNFSVGLNSSWDTGPTAATFSFHWESAGLSYTEQWIDDLQTGQTTGPNLSSSPAAYNGCCSSIWAGLEYQTTYSLTEVTGQLSSPDYQAIGGGNPGGSCCVPSGDFLHAVAATWVGLEANQGGSNGLIQMGIDSDWTSGSVGQVWIEFVGDGSSQSAIDFATAYDPYHGYHSGAEQVQTTSTAGTWQANWVDFSVHHTYSDTDQAPTSFSPSWGTFIVEAFSENDPNYNSPSEVQQISNLQGQVGWQNDQLFSGSTQVRSGFDTWDMISEMCNEWFFGVCLSYNNNADSFIGTVNGQYVPVVNWHNSGYDWNCVNGGESC